MGNTHVGDVHNDEERVEDAELVAQHDDRTPALAEMQPRVADWLEFICNSIGLPSQGRDPDLEDSHRAHIAMPRTPVLPCRSTTP